MPHIDYPHALQELVIQLKRMPGIGPRSAERIALWIVQGKQKAVSAASLTTSRGQDVAKAILLAVENVGSCTHCGFFTTETVCMICQDEQRIQESLCVVEHPTDILPLERTRVFKGYYHSLGGRLSPLEHVRPEDLRIEELMNRLRQGNISEVILALSADVEGEATAQYIASLLKDWPTPMTVTRIAQGLPVGGGLEAADELTLTRALTGRVRVP